MERPTEVRTEASSTRARLLALGLVLLAALAVFWPVLDNELVYDDLAIVTRNPRAASCSWKSSARSFGARATTDAPVVWISQACWWALSRVMPGMTRHSAIST